MIRSLVGIAVCLALGACGGGGGGDGESSTGTAPTAPVAPVAPAYSLHVSQVSRHAIALGDNRVLMSNQIFGTGDVLYDYAFPTFLVWDVAAKKITAAFKLSFPLSDFIAMMGAGGGSHNLMDLRPTADGGAILQFDLFSSEMDASGVNARKGHVIAKLGSDLNVIWSKVWQGEQYGTLDVRGDGYVSTGASLMSYDLAGNLKSDFSGLTLCSASLNASTSVVGTMGGYYVRRADDSLERKSAPMVPYAAVPASVSGVVLAGYGSEGNDTYSVVALTDAQGTPTKSVKFDYTFGGNGFRDVTRLGQNYYVLGSRVGALATGTADWVVCRLSSALAEPTCITGRNGSASSNSSIRADEANGRLLVANHTGSDPVLLLGPDLKPLVDPGYAVETMTTTVSPWDAGWSNQGRQSPISTVRSPVATLLSKTSLAVDTIDLSPLAGLLK